MMCNLTVGQCFAHLLTFGVICLEEEYFSGGKHRPPLEPGGPRVLTGVS